MSPTKLQVSDIDYYLFDKNICLLFLRIIWDTLDAAVPSLPRVRAHYGSETLYVAFGRLASREVKVKLKFSPCIIF